MCHFRHVTIMCVFTWKHAAKDGKTLRDRRKNHKDESSIGGSVFLSPRRVWSHDAGGDVAAGQTLLLQRRQQICQAAVRHGGSCSWKSWKAFSILSRYIWNWIWLSYLIKWKPDQNFFRKHNSVSLLWLFAVISPHITCLFHRSFIFLLFGLFLYGLHHLCSRIWPLW